MSRTANTEQMADWRQPFDQFLERIGLKQADLVGSISIRGEDPVLRSPLRLGLAPAIAHAANGAAVAALNSERNGIGDDISVDIVDAACSLNGLNHLRQNGVPINSSYNPRQPGNRFFRTADGKFIYVTMVRPAQQNPTLELLGCPNSNDAMEKAIAGWTADDLEKAGEEVRACITVARTHEEWLAHPQGQWVSRNPIVTIDKVRERPAMPLSRSDRPLSGVRVLEATQLLAGPNVGRTLAEQGADVLRIAPPYQSDFLHFVMDTGIGKRSAYLDLRRDEDIARFSELLMEADVFVQSFSPGSLERRGIRMEEVFDAHPGLIYVDASCFGREGPFSRRIGYDPNAQAATGIATTQGSPDNPTRPPTLFVADYLTGFIGAAAVSSALLKRCREGGSYRVSLSLAQTLTWLHGLGLVDGARGGEVPRSPNLVELDSPFGRIEALAPVARYAHAASFWELPPQPLGASIPEWRSRRM